MKIIIEINEDETKVVKASKGLTVEFRDYTATREMVEYNEDAKWVGSQNGGYMLTRDTY